jgi:hypothetical protein
VQFLGNGRHTQRPLRIQQADQHRLHTAFRLPGRQVQDSQVLLGCSPGLLLQQYVVGQAKTARREQVGLVAVVSERPGLADQPLDHVAVFDAVLVAASQAGQRLHQLLPEPDLDPFGVQPGFQPFPDQPAGHRIDIPLHPDGTAFIHPYLQPLAGLQPPGRQRSQQGQLLGLPLLPAAVGLLEQSNQKALVSRPAVEIPAAPQHQGLIQGSFELVVALLGIPILVALAGLDGLALQTVVLQ